MDLVVTLRLTGLDVADSLVAISYFDNIYTLFNYAQMKNASYKDSEYILPYLPLENGKYFSHSFISSAGDSYTAKFEKYKVEASVQEDPAAWFENQLRIVKLFNKNIVVTSYGEIRYFTTGSKMYYVYDNMSVTVSSMDGSPVDAYGVLSSVKLYKCEITDEETAHIIKDHKATFILR